MNLLLTFFAVIAVFTPQDTTYYESFPEALKKTNKENHAMMQLQSDVDFEGSAAAQTVKKNLTIDLNGYSLGATLSGTSLLSVNNDTVSLTVTSSRPGGKIWAVRNYNGKISAVSMSKGSLSISHVDIEVQNTKVYNASKAKSVAASGVSIAATGSMIMEDCRVLSKADKSAHAITASGGKASAADIQVRDCQLTARGKTTIYGLSTYSIARIENCVVDVEAQNNIAYGIYIYNYFDSIQGIDLEATIHNVRISSKADTKAYGIFTKSPLVMTRDTILAQAEGSTVQSVNASNRLSVQNCFLHSITDSTATSAIYLNAAAVARVTDCTLLVDSKGTGTGIYGARSKELSAELTLSDTYIRVTGETSVYGVNTFNQTKIGNCHVEALATGSTAYGININDNDSIQEAIVAQIHDVNVVTKADDKAYGIYTKANVSLRQDTVDTYVVHSAAWGLYMMNESKVQQCIIKAQADSSNAQGACLTSTFAGQIDDCSFSVETKGTAYGIYGMGNKNSIAQATLRNNRFRVTGRTNVYGITTYNQAKIENCHIESFATGSTAYGININKNDSIQEDVEAQIHDVNIVTKADSKAYGIYTKSNVSLGRDTVDVYVALNGAWGLYMMNESKVEQCIIKAQADSSNAQGACLTSTFAGQINDCSISIESAGTAYGIYGMGTKNAAAQVTLRNNRFRVTGEKTVYGIDSYSSAQIDSCDIEVTARYQTAYGIYLQNDTTQEIDIQARIRNTSIHTKSYKTAYGLYSRAENIQAEACDIIAEVDSTQAYGVYLYSGHAQINHCTVKANAKTAQAYAVYAGNSCSDASVQHCRLKAYGPEKAGVVFNNKTMFGKLFFFGGYYADDENLRNFIADTCSVYGLWDHEPEYADGYRFTVQPISNPDAIVACIYDEETDNMPMYRFYSILDGLNHINQHADKNLTLMVVGSCLIPKGEYTIPAKSTLVVAYDEQQKRAIGPAARRETRNITRTEFARLILADSAHLRVEGTLEVSALQKAGGSGAGSVTGTFGHIQLAPDASIDIRPGAAMQAWGYVTGEGLVEVQDSAAVHESLQIGDWKGARVTFAMLDNKQRVFPLTHYFYQNIEGPVLYHSGAQALGSMSETMDDIMVTFDGIKLVAGDSALFEMDSNDHQTTLIKRYNTLTDRMEWITNGNIALSELGISFYAGFFGQINLISSKYVLPLSTNTTIWAQNGELTILHDAVMLPGAEVDIAPDAKLLVPDNVNLYMYDTAEWKAYSNKRYSTVSWSPSWEDCPRDSVLQPAHITVGGELDIRGMLYATEGGADIVGSDEAEGIVRLAYTDKTDSIYQLTGNSQDFAYTPSFVQSAPLRNADGSYVPTERKGKYSYANGKWTVPDDDAIHTPNSRQSAKKIIDRTGMYIITAEGRKYTLLGQPVND